MPKYDRWILAAIADTHGGHLLGLLNPETILREYTPDGDEIAIPVSLNPSQQFLWELYEKHRQETIKLAGKDPIILMHLGDQSQGQKYPQQLVYSSVANQIIVAFYNIMPWVRHAEVTRMVWGTQSHIFYEATTPRLIEEMLRGRYPKKDIRSVGHGLLDVKGLLVDYAHHGPSKGIRNWLSGNQMRYYLKSMIADEIDAEKDPPDLVLRAHFHSRLEEDIHKFRNGKKHDVKGMVVPSYTLLTDHARQATKSISRVTNGMAAIEVINGKIHYVHWLTKTSDIRIKEKIA